MRFIYVVQIGYGELSQAESFAIYARERGVENIFITDKEDFKRLMDEYKFTTYVVKTSKDAIHLIKQLNPDVLIHCNSKTTYMYSYSLLNCPPLFPEPFCISLDSNWLFTKDTRSPFRTPDWLDLIFVVMPRSIFQQGLYENGGHYEISKDFLDKIFTPGFIPSGSKISQIQKEKIREELGIKKEEKLIFCYFGLKEDLLLKHFIGCLEKIVPFLDVKVYIKLNKEQLLPNHTWLMNEAKQLLSEKFLGYLASSDLIIQHHGLGTLPKAIRNQIPLICITEEVKGEYSSSKHSAYFEIKAFETLNLCMQISGYDFLPKSLKESMQILLFNEKEIRKMRDAQEKYFEEGEANAFNKLIQELRIWKDNKRSKKYVVRTL